MCPLLIYYGIFCDFLDTLLCNFILNSGLSFSILESEALITDLAAIYGVAQSWTPLKRLSSSSSSMHDFWAETQFSQEFSKQNILLTLVEICKIYLLGQYAQGAL